MRHHGNLFMPIDEAVAEIWRFFIFFKMAAIRHLGFVKRVFGPLKKSIWSLQNTACVANKLHHKRQK